MHDFAPFYIVICECLTLICHNTAGQVIKSFDPLGRITRSFYSTNRTAGSISSYDNEDPAATDLGFLVATCDPLDRISTFSYDALGRKITEDTPGNSDTARYVLHRTYDIMDRLIMTIYPDNTFVSNVYNAAGYPVRVYDRAGRETVSTYDAAGHVIRVDYPNGDWVKKEYTGNLVSKLMDAAGNTTEYFYCYEQLTGVRFPDGSTRAAGFDNFNRQIWTVDERGVAVTNAYDKLDRVVYSQYIPANDLGNVVNTPAAPAGRSASFQYDAAGRLTQESDFHGRVSSLSHSANERTTVVTRPDNTSMTSVRDVMGRLASITSAGGNSRATTFAWRNDGALRAASCTLAGDTVSDTYARNLAGEILGRTSSYSMAAAGPFIINYGCDAGGLVTNITSPLNAFSYREIERDALGRVTALNAAACAVSFTYDANSRLIATDKGDHAIDSISYDPLGRSTSLTIRTDTDEATFVPRLFVTNSFDHCAPARLLAQTITSYGKTTTSVSRVYSYDLLDQVCGEEMVANGTQAWYNTYAFNGFGDVITCRNEVVTYTAASTITRGSGGNAVAYRGGNGVRRAMYTKN